MMPDALNPPQLPNLPTSGGELFDAVMGQVAPSLALGSLPQVEAGDGLAQGFTAYQAAAPQVLGEVAHEAESFAHDLTAHIESLSRTYDDAEDLKQLDQAIQQFPAA